MLCLLWRVDDVRAESRCQIAPAQQLGLTHKLGLNGGCVKAQNKRRLSPVD